jgi:GNAT superfamily N-acetyltransferase
MHPGYAVRLAHREEVALLPAIERAAGQRFAGYDDLGLRPEHLLEANSVDTLSVANEDGRLWVAADATQTPVGFALVIDLGLFAHVEEIDVLPAHGRRGLGGALIEAVCSWSHTRGFSAVTLSTFRDVPWNAPFYARHGFVVIPPDELPPELSRIVQVERSKGLNTDLRVIMQREL